MIYGWRKVFCIIPYNLIGDGTRQDYLPYKIQDAIKKAFESESKEYDDKIFAYVMQDVAQKDLITVEDVQDFIEKALFNAGYFDVMKSFMLYRHTHKMQREQILGLNEDTTYINSTQTINEYINGTDWRISANSNTSYSNAGLINNTAGKVIANY